MGSNDLDLTRNLNININKLAEKLVIQALEIRCLPIPRAETKFHGLFEITKAFNDQVKILAEGKANVKVWVHKGLFKRDSHYLDRHGVHLYFRGTLQYYHSIQAAVRYHVARLR